MRYFTADFIFPITSSPLKNGIIATGEDGTIAEILPSSSFPENKNAEKFAGILCPGFINAHCHLELSYLKGKISEKKGLPAFINEIEAVRHSFSQDEIQKAIIEAENEMLRNGIAGVGDISNSDFSFKRKAGKRLRYHTFIEALGFHPGKADAAFEKCLELFEKSTRMDISSSITPHAPYSASQELLKKIYDHAVKNESVLSIHNQENADENRMFTEGGGRMLECLSRLGIDVSHWKPTGKDSLQSVFPNLPGKNKILFVHNTFTSEKDIEFLKLQDANACFCFCPRANLYIENRLPDFQMFLDADVRITVGTDSLASNGSLSILEELKTISFHAPGIPFSKLIRWATLNGAEFFGWEKELGSFEKGKKPGINLIRNFNLPAGKGADHLMLTEKSEVERIL